MDYSKKITDDRRIRRTKKLLKDSLGTLLMVKNIKNITVKEIVDLADINRGTFYLHYRDIYDMLTQIENDMLIELEEIANRFPGSVLKCAPRPYILEIFRYVAENQVFCKMLLGTHGDMAFVAKLKKVVEDKCFSSIMEACPENALQNYQFFATYSVSGSIGLLQSWLEDGMKVPPEELAQVTDDMIQNGIYSLQKSSNR